MASNGGARRQAEDDDDETETAPMQRGVVARASDKRSLLFADDKLPRLVDDHVNGAPVAAKEADVELNALMGDRRTTTAEFADDDDDGPPDRFGLVYIILLIHGVGALLPWNMFITAVKYFTEHKFSGSQTEYSKNFLSYLGICSQVPNLTLAFVNLFVQIRGSLTKRIVICLLINATICVITVGLAIVDSSDWPGVFFVVTMVTVVILNGSNGVYQNSIFGLAADFPSQYSNAVVFGTNICGTFVSTVSIIAIFLSPDLRIAAIYYFVIAVLVVFLCFDTYFVLSYCRFFRFHTQRGERRRHTEAIERKISYAHKMHPHATVDRVLKALRPYWETVKQGWVQLWNVFFVFFVTLTIFPAMQAHIEPVSERFPINRKFFAPIVCFFLFNFFAMTGNAVAHWIQFPGPRLLWLPVLARGLLIPYFMLCNYRPLLRTFPVYIDSDWAYVAMAVVMAVSSGYLSSLCMMYAPRVVDSDKARMAGMMAAFFLIAGICLGVNFTLVVAYVNENLGPLTPLGALANATAAP